MTSWPGICEKTFMHAMFVPMNLYPENEIKSASVFILNIPL